MTPNQIPTKTQDNFELVPVISLADAPHGGYCHLYKNGQQLTEDIYRKGGLGGSWKDGYITLIKYTRTEALDGNGGHFVIVNEEGEIVLHCPRFEHPSHFNGIIASIEENYYNLKTGKIIARGNTITYTKNHILIKPYWSSTPKIEGIIKLNHFTGEIEIID